MFSLYSKPARSRRLLSDIASLLGILILGIAVNAPAQAQELERRDTVAQRARPGLDPEGLPVRAMRLYPELGLEVLYNDNVFADDSMAEGDTALRLLPQLKLDSRSSRHRAEIGANLDIARYDDYDSEDFEDFRFWGLGEMQVRDGEIRAELRLAELHELRTSPDDRGGSGLTEYSRNSFYGAYTHRPGRLLIRGDLKLTNLDFDSTPGLPGSTGNNDDRDRDVADIGVRVGYGLSPDYALYTEARFDSVDYDQEFDRDGFRRSSDGVELRLGTLLDFTGRTSGEFYVGYISRDYDDSRFSDTDGPSFGGRVDWNITGLTTLSVSGDRSIDDTTIVGASGITKSRLTLSAEHELLRNLLIGAIVGVGNDDFENYDRDDDLRLFEIGGKYLMNRYTQVLFGYRYQDRDTSPINSGGNIYEINEVFVRIVGQL